MNDNDDRRGSRTLGALVLAAIALTASALLVIASAGSDTATYPADSAEAAFADYARSWEDGDVDAAYAAFSAGARSRVPTHEFRGTNRWRNEEATRIWIDERSGDDERAVLTLSIERSYGGLLGSDRYREHSRVVLVREDGDWRIDTPLVGYYLW